MPNHDDDGFGVFRDYYTALFLANKLPDDIRGAFATLNTNAQTKCVTFPVYEDTGLPILFMEEHGAPCDRPRRIAIMNEYLRLHLSTSPAHISVQTIALTSAQAGRLEPVR